MEAMSLRAEPWWASCVARVATESLERLAREFRVEVEDLAEALAEEGRGGPAQQAPWWPEAVRELEAGVSIRSVARRFQTEPRRIRRALARTAIRAGGTGFGADGLPALAEFVDRLGKEPDIKIAAAAHVAIEAVQGERRRRGIPGYHQRRTRRAKLTADDMQWIRGPKRNRREKFKPEADVQVVRRPVRNEAPPPTMVVRRSLDGDRGHFEASPRGEAPRGEALSRGPVRPAWTPRAEEPPPPPRPYERPWVKSERQEEIDQLLSVQRRQRDGRQRIVRAESQRPELAEPERSPRVIRRTAGAPGTTWRAVDPALAPPPEPVTPPRPVVESRPEPVRPEPVVTRPEPVVRPVEVRTAPTPPVLVKEPVRPVVAPPPAAPTAVRRVVRPEPAFRYPPIPPAPVQMVAEPTEPPAPRPAREPRAKAMAPRATASARPGHVEVLPPQVAVHTPEPARAAPVAWYVQAPDGEAPFVLYATDITEALVAASARLAPELLARACIWRVGEPRPTV